MERKEAEKKSTENETGKPAPALDLGETLGQVMAAMGPIETGTKEQLDLNLLSGLVSQIITPILGQNQLPTSRDKDVPVASGASSMKLIDEDTEKDKNSALSRNNNFIMPGNTKEFVEENPYLSMVKNILDNTPIIQRPPGSDSDQRQTSENVMKPLGNMLGFLSEVIGNTPHSSAAGNGQGSSGRKFWDEGGATKNVHSGKETEQQQLSDDLERSFIGVMGTVFDFMSNIQDAKSSSQSMGMPTASLIELPIDDDEKPKKAKTDLAGMVADIL